MWQKFVRMHDGISNLTLQISIEIATGRYDRQWRWISYEKIISFYFLKVGYGRASAFSGRQKEKSNRDGKRGRHIDAILTNSYFLILFTLGDGFFIALSLPPLGFFLFS